MENPSNYQRTYERTLGERESSRPSYPPEVVTPEMADYEERVRAAQKITELQHSQCAALVEVA